jgi:hypothetical protein
MEIISSIERRRRCAPREKLQILGRSAAARGSPYSGSVEARLIVAGEVAR